MKNIKFFPFIILFALAACNQQTQSESSELAVPVSVEDIRLQSIEQFVSTTGTVNATSEVTLNSEMAGDYFLQTNPATGRPFKLGDRVSKGQTIIRFENEEYVNNLAIDAVKLNLEISEQEYDKQKSLYEKGGVTLRELRNSEVSKTNAQYNYENAQIQMAKMSVSAPFSGVIVELPYYTNGVRIASGAQMATIMSYSQMYMSINLPEKNIGELQLGQEVLVTNYTLPEDTLRGKVTEMSPAISTETRTFSGRIDINNSDLKLRPGMFVKADVITARKDSTIVIPKDVILSGNRGKYVFIVGRNSAADDRRITTGLENQDFVEVIEGLSVNDRLIIKGFETLRDDSKVRIIR
ncbi:RND family efflux transporter, MFP subunit [Mariniphaga anaerophila]|uniref:RND family efflux transporter, MFP subunit n=1 Tax=Mariniphaga anaerophila TaxID=1484053 RepID=A0A1M5BPP2_9BACT|nr:efflux RND transporter periplasmic adaptor subunit [Mariniphaga anaerophila]SHF44217.1 RND family efflux transporter, MFP subunit [Mariniphaga anaerophila]